jgi:hypothetical protein
MSVLVTLFFLELRSDRNCVFVIHWFSIKICYETNKTAGHAATADIFLFHTFSLQDVSIYETYNIFYYEWQLWHTFHTGLT